MLRTQEQQRKICSTCPIAKTANLIGDSYVLLIIRELLSGPKRFRDFEYSLCGTSTRTLANKLKMLEKKKLVKRTDDRHGKIEYSLTKEGAGLKGIAEAMEKYGEKFL